MISITLAPLKNCEKMSLHIFGRTLQRFKGANSRDNAFSVNISVSSRGDFPAAEFRVFVDCADLRVGMLLSLCS